MLTAEPAVSLSSYFQRTKIKAFPFDILSQWLPTMTNANLFCLFAIYSVLCNFVTQYLPLFECFPCCFHHCKLLCYHPLILNYCFIICIGKHGCKETLGVSESLNKSYLMTHIWLFFGKQKRFGSRPLKKQSSIEERQWRVCGSTGWKSISNPQNRLQSWRKWYFKQKYIETMNCCLLSTQKKGQSGYVC